MNVHDIENVQNSQCAGDKSPVLKVSGLKAKSLKSPSSRGKSPRKSSNSRILGMLDDISLAESALKKSSSKKKRSSLSSATPIADQQSINLDSLLGAAESSPIIELGDVKYRPSLAPQEDDEGVYPPVKRSSATATQRTRRETFVGGSEEVEQILRGASDGEEDNSQVLDGIVFDSGAQKNTRRETCDAADMEAMLQDLENDQEDNESPSFTDSSRNMSSAVLSEYEESPGAMPSPYSNLLSMSQTSNRSSRNHPSSRFVSSSSLSTSMNSEGGDQNRSRGSSGLGDIIFDRGNKKDSRRMTVDSTDMADMLQNLDNDDSTFDTAMSTESVNPRRQTCDTADMEEMLRDLNDADEEASECAAVTSSSLLDVSAPASPVPSSALPEVVTTPQRRGRLSGSGKKNKKMSASKRATRRETFVGGSEEVEQILRGASDVEEDNSQVLDGIVFDSGAQKNTRRETCDAADMEAMLQDLENDQECDESSGSVLSSNSTMDPKFRDIIVHDELNLTTSTSECVSPTRAVNLPEELPMRRSPRLHRQATKQSEALEEVVAEGKSKSKRKSLTRSVRKSERRDVGVAVTEKVMDDADESSPVVPTKDRRLTADAGDIQKIMKELEEEDAQQKNILGHRGLSASSHELEFSPCPGSRDSVDTVVLMNSVAALLEKVEGGEDEECDNDSPAAQTNLHFEDSISATPASTGSSELSSPLLNMSVGASSTQHPPQQRHQQSWQDLSVDDYTMRSFQSEEGSCLDTEEGGDVSDDGTVNTVDLLSDVRHLVKGSTKASSLTPPSSSSYHEVSIQSDLSDDTSFLSRDERRDSFDDNTVSTMGSLREFLQDDSGALHDTSSSSVPTARVAKSAPSASTPDSLHALARPAAPPVLSPPVAFQSPPLELGGSTQPLKSCLSSRKKTSKQRAAVFASVSTSTKKRGVVFGSPQAAEFHKTSPITSFTPMHEKEAKSLFSMAGKSAADEQEEYDEQTKENSSILDEWDRLTNASVDGSGSDEESGSSDVSDLAGSPAVQRGGGRRATIGGTKSATKKSLISPSKGKKRRQSVQAAIPMLQNSASLRRNKRRKSRLHTSDPDIQLSAEVESASGMDITDTSMDVSCTEHLPGNLEELMKQPDLLPSPAGSTCSSFESSTTPTALNNLVRSSVLNASMSMASLNDSMTDRTQTLETDLSALMCRVEKSTEGNGVTSFRPQSEAVLQKHDEVSEDDISRRLSGSSGQSSLAGGLGALLDSQEEEELDSGGDYDAPARLRQIAASSSPLSTSDDSRLEEEVEEGNEITVDNVVSFHKRRRMSTCSASSSVLTKESELNESTASDSQEFTQELETNLDTLMQTVIQDAVSKPSSMDDVNDEFSVLTTSMMENDQSSVHGVEDDSGLEAEVQIMQAGEGEDDGVVTFGRSERKSLIGQGECDISCISQSLESLDDSRSTVPEEDNSFSGLDHGALGVSSVSLGIAAETPNMLRKLRGLNAVSRRQSLTHASHTPMAGRMSVGTKRLSLANQQLESTTKRMAQRYEQRFAASKHKESEESLCSLELAEGGRDVSVSSSAPSAKSPGRKLSQQNKESFRDEMLQEFLSQLNLSEAVDTKGTLFDVLTTFCESYTLDQNCFLNSDSQALLCSEVNAVFSDVLGAAIEETTQNCSLMEGDMTNMWHCVDQTKYSALMVTLQDQDSSSSSSMEQLRNVAQEKLTQSCSQWHAWELELMQVVLEAITAKKLALRYDNEELELELRQSEERAADRESAVDCEEALQQELAAVQNRLVAVREEVAAKKQHLASVQKEHSSLRVMKKTHLVALATEAIDKVRSSASPPAVEEEEVEDVQERERVASQTASSQDLQLLQDANEEVIELQYRVNILNKITYCRIVTYKSTQIKARVQLTRSLSIDLSFDLKCTEAPVKGLCRSAKAQRRTLRIEQVSCVPSFDPEAPLASLTDSESMLAAAYYSQFLSSASRCGPLSTNYLGSLEQVTDIPQCLRQVSAHVSTLRASMTWLGHMHLSAASTDLTVTAKTKWVWGMSESAGAAGSSRNFVVFLQHASQGRVEIPLAALISGDMGLLPADFSSVSHGQSPGAGHDLSAMQRKLSLLADRCDSPFGSFPIGQIMHTIAPS